MEAIPEFNEPLARAVLEQIKRYPDLWDQENWAKRTSCGTSFCFAGWTCIIGDGMSEERIDWSPDPWDHGETEVAVYYSTSSGRDGYVRKIAIRAALLLGLTYGAAMELFGSTNEIEDLERMVNELSGPDIHDALDLDLGAFELRLEAESEKDGYTYG